MEQIEQQFTRADVLAKLHDIIEKTSYPSAASELGFSKNFLFCVNHGTKPLSAGLALKLGFIRLEQPEIYVQAPQKATTKRSKQGALKP